MEIRRQTFKFPYFWCILLFSVDGNLMTNSIIPAFRSRYFACWHDWLVKSTSPVVCLNPIMRSPYCCKVGLTALFLPLDSTRVVLVGITRGGAQMRASVWLCGLFSLALNRATATLYCTAAKWVPLHFSLRLIPLAALPEGVTAHARVCMGYCSQDSAVWWSNTNLSGLHGMVCHHWWGLVVYSLTACSKENNANKKGSIH